ncbi:MarR family transcriptional regulator [Microbacterium sp. M28]|uniref:MarR family winged helix-turn-helix transcriptional regulator n=1 Tax=Microbacterium sp. M28 TaxID=2962064 RepID=UPI0021F4D61A|nr:MarR family transcriptional regulator [Microbacterium sp. M28]UYO98387.1 MarR family transcriptional regulator [Microbacterium sp. M28]
MNRTDVVPSLVLSAHALARIAAQDAGNEAPSAQWRVLSILEREGGIRLGSLARAARTTQPGMTRLIGDLERAGLVERSSDPVDSRATVVDITAAGREAAREWRTEFRRTLAPRFADLSDADWDALARAAEILAAHTVDSPDTKTGDSE